MLYVDASTIGRNRTGLGRYADQIVRLAEDESACRVIHSEFYRPKGENSVMSDKRLALGERGSAWRRLFSRAALKLEEQDLVISPTQHFSTPPEQTVITIHDLIALSFPRQHPFQYIYFKLYLPLFIRRFKAIFTVSEFSKGELVRVYGLSASRIFVVPNAKPPLLRPGHAGAKSVDTGVLSGRPFLLCVGAAYGHKNIHELLAAADTWKSTYDIKIASARGAYREQLLKLIRELKLSGRVEVLGHVSDEALRDLYENCAALVYPSKLEGFGIPPLEAMALGRPCLVSDIPVHREILGDYPIFVQLGSRQSWSQAFKALQSWSYEDPVVRSAADEVFRRFDSSAIREKFGRALGAVAHG